MKELGRRKIFSSFVTDFSARQGGTFERLKSSVARAGEVRAEPFQTDEEAEKDSQERSGVGNDGSCAFGIHENAVAVLMDESGFDFAIGFTGGDSFVDFGSHVKRLGGFVDGDGLTPAAWGDEQLVEALRALLLKRQQGRGQKDIDGEPRKQRLAPALIYWQQA